MHDDMVRNMQFDRMERKLNLTLESCGGSIGEKEYSFQHGLMSELPTTCSREVGASYRKDTLSCCATPLGAVRWRFSLTPVSLPVFIYIIILSYVTVCYYTAMLSFSFVGHCQLQRPWPWQPHLLPSTSGKKG